jgi:hypothetical protein
MRKMNLLLMVIMFFVFFSSANAQEGYKVVEGDISELPKDVVEQLDATFSPGEQDWKVELAEKQELDAKFAPEPNDLGGPGCQSGNYVASGIPSGGALSSFQFNYSISNGVVTNVFLALNGIPILWSWQTGTTFYGSNGLCGYTVGTATYYGLLTVTWRLNWCVKPDQCLITTWWS